MIHETAPGKFVISSRQVWLPGVYDSRRAANYAFRFSDKELDSLSRKVNRQEGKLISFKHLQELRQAVRPPEL